MTPKKRLSRMNDNTVYCSHDNRGHDVPLVLTHTPDEYAQKSRSNATKLAYASDLKGFSSWCRANGLSSFPAAPSTVAKYISERANQGRKVATIRRCLSAIAMTHRRAGQPNPAESGEVLAVMEGITRVKKLKANKKAPLTIEILRAVLKTVPKDQAGIRDRAVLLIQYAAALRRSELVALRVEDLDFTADGLKLTIQKSKTDQRAEGAIIGIPYGDHEETCPVRALKSWLREATIEDGPVFRRIGCYGHLGDKALVGGSVARIVKQYIELAGYDPNEFSGHSARAGFITSASINGASEHEISRVSRHKTAECLWDYIRPATVFQGSAASKAGL